MRFLRPEDEREDQRLFEEALELGMERSDLVVRRRLIQRMRLAIEAGAREAEPSDTELEAYLAMHSERFSAPARARFTHVLVDPIRRGDAAREEAEQLLQRLRSTGDRTEVAIRLGDPSVIPRDDALRSERELAKLFGPEFAARVLQLTPGRWEGPIASLHGFHLVRVHEREPGGPLPLASVHNEVRYALLAERGDEALRSAVGELRQRYRVRIAP
jgi:parvulin-like peptidyl-prolyl isomerase